MTTLPVSELRNYNQVLNDVSYGEQVILTKNGRAQYAVVNIDEWQKQKAKLRLL
ncbi:type II toxin-antitoxin system prevent-host-death family antitoxin, partial [Streptococcus sp. DD10]|uniref:type II toxin-antitoxin system prevent-host-death family antitoxin n=1 Tax=Streptococcus sp. DD10 TaxID=1777878 RepID=UPI000AFC84E1